MGELPFPKSLPEFQKLFPDDAHCAAYMERVTCMRIQGAARYRRSLANV
jgi:hypothetical protein